MSAAGEYNTLYSEAFYQVSGGQLVAELDVSQVGDALVLMELEGSDDFQVSIRLQNGELGLHVVDGSGDRMVDSAPLEQEHVWWRLREEAGQFFWATAPDLDSWTEHGGFPASIGELARVSFDVTPIAASGTLIVHAVNAGTEGVYCPAASFRDEFASLSPRWLVDEQGDCQITVAGLAELGYSAQAFCALSSRERFDLRDSSFAVELAQVFDCVPQPIMRIDLATSQQLSILCRDDGGTPELVAAASTGGDRGEIVYLPGTHRFVRLHHDREAGAVSFDTSPDGADSWSPFASLPIPDAVLARASLRFYLGGDTSGGFESVAFDSLNLAP